MHISVPILGQHHRINPSTRGLVVPGVGFEPTLPRGKGGLSGRGAVRAVLWIPFAQLRWGAPVRRVRLAGLFSVGAGESCAGSVQEIDALEPPAATFGSALELDSSKALRDVRDIDRGHRPQLTGVDTVVVVAQSVAHLGHVRGSR